MRGIIQALLLFILSGTAPALAQTPDERARLDWAEQRGRLLYEVDRAAWVTTDDLRRRVPDLRSSGIRGWIVERDGAGYAVTFYAGEGDTRVAAYRARVANNRVAGAELIAPARETAADAAAAAAGGRASWPSAAPQCRPAPDRASIWR